MFDSPKKPLANQITVGLKNARRIRGVRPHLVLLDDPFKGLAEATGDELANSRSRWATETAAMVNTAIREGLAASNVTDPRGVMLMRAGFRMALRQLRHGTITRTRAGSMSLAEATELEEALGKVDQ